jgi:hypothetical protein
LTLDDAKALAEISGVVGVAPEIDSFAQIVASGNSVNACVVSTTPDYIACGK